MTRLLLLLAVAMAMPPWAQSTDPNTPPRIFLDQPLNIVEYQLNRLPPAQLERVPRNDADARYRPVYLALLTRAGVAQAVRDEAVAALVKITSTSATEVLVGAAGRVAADQGPVVEQLLRMIVAQPVAALRRDRPAVVRATQGAADDSASLRAGYVAMIAADGSPTAAWAMAAGRVPHVAALLRGVSVMPPSATAVRSAIAPIAQALLMDSIDDMAGTGRAAAIGALAWARPDAATFGVVAGILAANPTDAVRAAAVTALLAVPENAISAAAADPVIARVLERLDATPPGQRTSPASLELRQLGERLAGRLPVERARERRRALRALGVQVVRLETVPEEVRFDRRWFAVGAGKSVELVLFNPDAMPHNVVVGQPGSLEKIGQAGNAMTPPTDPATKAFVPNLPEVLFSTRLAGQGETIRLTFTAPKEPGAYVFVCTFPGHWTRMYGVMLVVADLEAWEATPTPPVDPMSGRPF